MEQSGHLLCTFGLNRVLQFLVLTSVCWTYQDSRVEATTTCDCAADCVSYCTAGHKATSCSEVKSVNPAADDGEYTLHPFSADNDVSLRVYCHDMTSGNPKEFLSLPAGPDENYSIVSPDQLFLRSACTGILQLYQYVSRAGTTKFRKLRIKFENSSVEVIRDDYTFASTRGPNEISYAHAGDCYSEVQGCAKGTFKVNLTGTKLMLAPDVHWALEERNPASLTINDMFISTDRKVASARCGGACGHCWPVGNKLNLLYSPDVNLASERPTAQSSSTGYTEGAAGWAVSGNPNPSSFSNPLLPVTTSLMSTFKLQGSSFSGPVVDGNPAEFSPAPLIAVSVVAGVAIVLAVAVSILYIGNRLELRKIQAAQPQLGRDGSYKSIPEHQYEVIPDTVGGPRPVPPARVPPAVRHTDIELQARATGPGIGRLQAYGTRGGPGGINGGPVGGMHRSRQPGGIRAPVRSAWTHEPDYNTNGGYVFENDGESDTDVE